MPRINYKKIREDLYFMASFEGLIKVNPYVTYYSSHNSHINKNIRSIVEHNGHIWTGGYGSGFCRLDSNDFTIITADFFKGNYKNVLNGGFSISENESWFFTEGYSSMLNLKNNKIHGYQIYINGKKSWNRGFYIDTLNDGRLAFSLQYDNFGILDSLVDYRIYINSISDECGLKYGDTWIFDQDSEDRIWLGRFTAGIAVYDINSETVVPFLYDLEDHESFGVISLLIDQYDQMWLGTTNGLYILPNVSDFDIYTENIFEKAIAIDLPDDDKSRITSIKKAGDYIVIGNNTGLSFIRNILYQEGVNFNPIHQLKYGEDINGSGTGLNSLYFDKKRYLWVSVIDGVLKIDMWGIEMDISSVEIVFEKIKSGNTILKVVDNVIEISPDKRNLSLSFRPKNNPSFLNNIYYDYILTNENKDTIAHQIRSQNSKYNLDYISPGEYIFSVHAYKNGILKDSKSIVINVLYYSGENPWFWTVLMTGLFILFGGFMFYRKEQIKKLSDKQVHLTKLAYEKDKMKIQAIINSFNPHFINNSLHCVQSRYRKDDVLVKLISNLSDNIARIFRKTKKGKAYHTLSNELKLVENYISIQQIRFSNSFSFEVINDASSEILDTNILLMHLQIHTENALEHGIRNRDKSTFVKIFITEEENSIVIKIEDDGGGRRVALANGSKGTQMGTKMIKQLIEIFNEKNQEKIIDYYEDDIFENEKGKKFGTRVVIKYPIRYEFKV